jgi:beta-aspartyl-peptidase (threonine type)
MPIALAIHGGAGVISREEIGPDRDRQYRAGLAAALEAGYQVLRAGGAALDAVTAAAMALEEDPLFNAGRGAAYTWDGTHELDAAIMDGATRKAGAVAGLTVARNPVRVARRVLEACPHLLLAYAGADAFARKEGLADATQAYFDTEFRLEALRLEKARIAAGISDLGVPADRRHGTIGAVALDAQGRLAAATSTGGATAKLPGRIGDSPLIGAGTWADANCAVSCTGLGEFFIRAGAAHDVAARMAYLGQTVQEAADEVILRTLTALGGTGGMVALDVQGRVAMPMNSEGMYRAMVDGGGRRLVAIYAGECGSQRQANAIAGAVTK